MSAPAHQTRYNNRLGWMLVAPALAIVLIVGAIPLMAALNMSFHDMFTRDSSFWVGTQWYRDILQSPRFYATLARSTLFSALVLLIEIPLGIYLALCLPKKGPWVSPCLVAFAFPLLVPWNMIPIIWISVLNEETGLIGMALSAFGLTLDWKMNALHTWIALLAIDVWHWTSLVIILCYSALSTIPAPYYQAAAIDGASRWQTFRHVELPKMGNVLLMALLLRFMDSFLIYTEPFRFNAGGPDNATMFLAMELGEEIAAFNYGPSAARSVIYVCIILTIAWAFTTLRNRLDADPPAQATP